MSEISPLSHQPASLVPLTDRRSGGVETVNAVRTRGDDSVEVSQAAQLFAKLAELPDVRQDLVSRVRGEIEAGTYETDAKLDAAIDSMLNDL